jgi:hypothetical protein
MLVLATPLVQPASSVAGAHCSGDRRGERGSVSMDGWMVQRAVQGKARKGSVLEYEDEGKKRTERPRSTRDAECKCSQANKQSNQG